MQYHQSCLTPSPECLSIEALQVQIVLLGRSHLLLWRMDSLIAHTDISIRREITQIHASPSLGSALVDNHRWHNPCPLLSLSLTNTASQNARKLKLPWYTPSFLMQLAPSDLPQERLAVDSQQTIHDLLHDAEYLQDSIQLQKKKKKV